MGTLAQTLPGSSVIISNDKDMLQVVSDEHQIQVFQKKTLLNEQGVVDMFGFSPSQWVDFMSLCGDRADNIPGVSGVGEVAASKLINRFQSLDNLYASLNDITKTDVKRHAYVRKQLEGCREDAFLSKTLLSLCLTVPLPEDAQQKEHFQFPLHPTTQQQEEEEEDKLAYMRSFHAEFFFKRFRRFVDSAY